MRPDADVDVEIAARTAVAPHVALADDADARAVGEARWNVDRERLGADLHLLPGARRADGLTQRAGAAALRARLGEDHVAARRFHDARSVAVHAPRLADVQPAEAVARAAVLLARHRDRALPAAQRLLELQQHRLVQIDAALGLAARAARLALAEHVGEQIAEGRRVGAVHAYGEVEALEPVGPRPHVLVARPRRVVLAPAIGIAQRLVRLGNLAELLLRQPIARVDVRVVLAREALVRALDVVQRRPALQTEDDVQVHADPPALRSGRSLALRLPFID